MATRAVYRPVSRSARIGILCIGTVLTLGACSSLPRHSDRALYPHPEKDQHVSCAGTEEDHCARASPLLRQAEEAAAQGENLLTILDSGNDALVVLVHMIRAAHRTIDIQTFIWADDATGRMLFLELLQAARRGVRVRIIADQMFSTKPAKLLAWIATAHQNLTLKFYNPVDSRGDTSLVDYMMLSPLSFDNLNHRMHNKLVIVDGVIGTTGGRNFTDQYYDRGNVYNYLDRDVLALGSVVAQMQASFESYWRHYLSVDIAQLPDVHRLLFAGEEQLEQPSPTAPDPTEFDDVFEQAHDPEYLRQHFVANPHRVKRVVFLADEPGKGLTRESRQDDKLSSTIRDTMKAARRSIIMQSPYFVLTKPTIEALYHLRKQNPGIQLLMSTNSLASTDAYYVYALSFKRKKTYVAKLKFRIFELKPQPGDLAHWMPRVSLGEFVYEPTTDPKPRAGSETGKLDLLPIDRPGMRVGIHQKSMVVDDMVSIIGSHNLDPRSTYINTEGMLVIWDQAFSVALKKSIMRATLPANSWTVAKQQQIPILGHVSGVFGSMSRALPIFDLWPFRYSTSFELVEGETVPPSDPGFYERYEDVGQFPEVGLSPKDIATRLISAFAGFTESQM